MENSRIIFLSSTVLAKSFPDTAHISHQKLELIEHTIPMIATKDIGALGGALLLESWSGKRAVELEAKTGVSSADIAATLTDLLGKPAKAEPVPRARW